MKPTALELLCPMALPLASADEASRLAQWQWLHAQLRRAGLHRARRMDWQARSEPGQQGGVPPLAHERWLAAQWQLAQPDAAASLLLRSRAQPAPPLPTATAQQAWLLRPVHLHLGRDHLVLGHPDPRDQALPDPQAWVDVLQEAIAPDWSLQLWSSAPDEPFFVLHTPAALDWQPRSSLQAAGRSIEAYLPQGKDARHWRRFLNHAQMLLHEHPLNQAREQQGLAAINGLWLEGRIDIPERPAPRPVRLAGLAPLLAKGMPPDSLHHALSYWLEDWIGPASLGDEAGWRSTWQALLDVLASHPVQVGALPRHWHFFGEDAHLSLESRPGDGWRFWRNSLPPRT